MGIGGETSERQGVFASEGTFNRRFVAGLGRGVGGALIFALPMLMTMEMWELGAAMDRWRLILLLVLNLPLLGFLASYIGFVSTASRRDHLRNTMVAYAIGILTSAAVLTVFGVFDLGTTWREFVGTVALQSVPASIGAMLARSQLGGADDNEDCDDGETEESYVEEIFLMVVGAVFLGLNVAPTEEMILISYLMEPWHALALALVSIALMHGFVFAAGFQGGYDKTSDEPVWSEFLRFTLTGYAVALLVSLYVLWTFGRTEDVGAMQIVMNVVVLAFPAAIGASASRLIL